MHRSFVSPSESSLSPSLSYFLLAEKKVALPTAAIGWVAGPGLDGSSEQLTLAKVQISLGKTSIYPSMKRYRGWRKLSTSGLH